MERKDLKIISLMIGLFWAFVMSSGFVLAGCLDSDGGKDVYVTSTTHYYEGLMENVYWDTCEGSDKVKEYYCNGTEPFPVFDIIDCEDGCESGRCIGQSISESYCEDSDGGGNIYERGFVKGNVNTGGETTRIAHYDVCRENEYIDEWTTKHHSVYSCSGDNCYIEEYFPVWEGAERRERCASEFIKCPEGCEDGACSSSNTPDIECFSGEDCVINETEKFYCDEDKMCITSISSRCASPGTEQSRCDYPEEVNCIPCENGCENKKCIEAEIYQRDIVIDSKEVAVVSDFKTIAKSNKTYLQTSEGNKEIKISPEEAVANAKKISDVEDITIVEIDGKWVYSLSGKKKAWLFFIIPLNADVTQNIDVEDGSVVSTKKPWWHIFALGI